MDAEAAAAANSRSAFPTTSRHLQGKENAGVSLAPGDVDLSKQTPKRSRRRPLRDATGPRTSLRFNATKNSIITTVFARGALIASGHSRDFDWCNWTFQAVPHFPMTAPAPLMLAWQQDATHLKVLHTGWLETTVRFTETKVVQYCSPLIDQCRILTSYGPAISSAFGDHNQAYGFISATGELLVPNSATKSGYLVPHVASDTAQRFSAIAVSGTGQVAAVLQPARTSKSVSVLQWRAVGSVLDPYYRNPLYSGSSTDADPAYTSPGCEPEAATSQSAFALNKRLPPGDSRHHESLPDSNLFAWHLDPSSQRNRPTAEHIVPGHCVQLVANEVSFTLLNTRGEVYTWGDGRFPHCLGRDISDKQPADQPCLVTSVLGLNLISIDSGGWASAAVSQAGECYIWGQLKEMHSQMFSSHGSEIHKADLSYTNGVLRLLGQSIDHGVVQVTPRKLLRCNYQHAEPGNSKAEYREEDESGSESDLDHESTGSGCEDVAQETCDESLLETVYQGIRYPPALQKYGDQAAGTQQVLPARLREVTENPAPVTESETARLPSRETASSEIRPSLSISSATSITANEIQRPKLQPASPRPPFSANKAQRDPSDYRHGKEIATCAVGHHHILILTRNGTLYGAGRNDRGQLGLGVPLHMIRSWRGVSNFSNLTDADFSADGWTRVPFENYPETESLSFPHGRLARQVINIFAGPARSFAVVGRVTHRNKTKQGRAASPEA